MTARMKANAGAANDLAEIADMLTIAMNVLSVLRSLASLRDVRETGLKVGTTLCCPHAGNGSLFRVATHLGSYQESVCLAYRHRVGLG